MPCDLSILQYLLAVLLQDFISVLLSKHQIIYQLFLVLDLRKLLCLLKNLQLQLDLFTLFSLHSKDILDFKSILGLPAPALLDHLLVLFLVACNLFVCLEHINVVSEIEDDIFHHLKVVIELAEGLKILLLLVEISKDLSSDINLLVNVSILKQLQPYKMKAVVRKYSQI